MSGFDASGCPSHKANAELKFQLDHSMGADQLDRMRLSFSPKQKELYIRFSPPERRHMDLNDMQSVIKILSESA